MPMNLLHTPSSKLLVKLLCLPQEVSSLINLAWKRWREEEIVSAREKEGGMYDKEQKKSTHHVSD